MQERRCGLVCVFYFFFFIFFLEEDFRVLLCALCLIMSDGVCTVSEWDIIVQNKSSSQSQCNGWAGHLWHCAWQVWYVSVGRDVLQRLHCAALGACLSFSCQLCIFPKEHAAQLFSERKHWMFGMGWLHLHSCVCRWRISLWLPGLFFGGPVKNQPWTYPPLAKWTISSVLSTYPSLQHFF